MKKLLIVLLILGFVAPAMAAEVSISGSNWVMLCYQSQDEDWRGIEDGDFGGSGDGGDLAGENTLIYIPKAGKSNNINFNAKVSDSLSSYMEIGLGPGPGAPDDAAYVKHALATWNFGAGKLTFGWGEAQDTWMAAFPVFVDAGPYIGNGTMYHVRKSLIQLGFGGFNIAFRENSGNTNGTFDDVDSYIPEVSASYVWANKMIFIKGAGGFQTYAITDHAQDETVNITSFDASLQVNLTFGPAKIGVGGYYAVNPSNASFLVFNVPGSAAVAANGDVEDASVMGGSFTAGFKISPSFGINAGVVYQQGNQEGYADNGDDDDQASCTNAFFNVDTKIGPIMVTPEVGWQGKSDERGSRIYVSTLFKVFW